MLNYDKLIQEGHEELEAKERGLRRSALSYRIRMLRLLKSGECRSLGSAATQLGYSLRQCQRWFKSYRQGGLEALLAYEQPRKPERMTQEAWGVVKEAMTAGEVATLEEVRQLLTQQGINYKGVAGVSALLIRHKVKLKTGRPRHRQTDEAAQAAFKKTSPAS